MSSSDPPPGGSGDSGSHHGKGQGENNSSGTLSTDSSRESQALLDIFGSDMIPAAVVLVLLLLNLLRGKDQQHTSL
jgi:hypothetical protein